MASSPSRVTPSFFPSGLVLGLLLSTAAAMRGCSGPYQQLLSQLQRQANLTEDTSSLLEPYVSTSPLWLPRIVGVSKGVSIAPPQYWGGWGN